MITIELPNYAKLLGIEKLATDMADNYYLQVAAELGIFALIAALWIFWEIIRMFKTTMTGIRDNKLKKLIINIFLILPIMLAMFVFGAHTYFMEIAFLFYMFMGIIVSFGTGTRKIINI